ncbi:MAG: prepilin-type N-terminal cleavage/methylation domain-containing protein [Candidatus Omnitrophica bacterium]|nr:prepilin-type N-terminal cleavage/methylation domain-containing protein [Candidatus Omnitrophota bacterium]
MAFQHKHNSGFTLLEMMIGAMILIVALVGIIAAYTGCFTLNETARNLTIAINGCQEKLEEIRNESFGQIFANYNSTTFEVAGLSNSDSEGVVEVNNTNPDLLRISVTICWQQKGDRIFGEDSDLDGALDAGEDVNGNDQLDSPAKLVTLIARR